MSSEASINEALEPLFNPRSIAVIGATNSWNKWGFSTFASILNGFEGKVFPVNNQESEVLGHKAYPRVTDIPEDEPVDLAVFVIPRLIMPVPDLDPGSGTGIDQGSGMTGTNKNHLNV